VLIKKCKLPSMDGRMYVIKPQRESDRDKTWCRGVKYSLLCGKDKCYNTKALHFSVTTSVVISVFKPWADICLFLPTGQPQDNVCFIM